MLSSTTNLFQANETMATDTAAIKSLSTIFNSERTKFHDLSVPQRLRYTTVAAREALVQLQGSVTREPAALLLNQLGAGLGRTTPYPSNVIDKFLTCCQSPQPKRYDVARMCHVWSRCMRTPEAPPTALLIIDVQNDFISGSLSLSACEAKEVRLDTCVLCMLEQRVVQET
eukprot:m.47278 g.47278  ORF g.47278 m.47278 type:complete len:171 (-) comp13213_c0_seq1:84-596(-)